MRPVTNHIVIRRYRPGDEAAWLRFRLELWPDSGWADAQAWVRRDAITLVAEDRNTQELVGFAEVGERPYADGCETSPVAFLEGWFVSAAARGTGVGSRLVHAAVLWAKGQNPQELASDSALDDTIAFRAHLAVGFEEVERSIKYRLLIADQEVDAG